MTPLDHKILTTYTFPMAGETHLKKEATALGFSGALNAEQAGALYDKVHGDYVECLKTFVADKEVLKQYPGASLIHPRSYALQMGNRLQKAILSTYGIDVFSKPPEKAPSLLSWLWSYLPQLS